MLNEAALEAVRRDGLTITSGDVYNAMDRILEVGGRAYLRDDCYGDTCFK